MMVGYMVYVWERPETAAELAKNPPSQADLFFDRLDVNGDDFITPDEIPQRLRPIIQGLRLQLPEKMSRAEFTKLFDEMRKQFQKKQPNQKGEEKK